MFIYFYIYISGFRNQFQPESAESSRRAFFFVCILFFTRSSCRLPDACQRKPLRYEPCRDDRISNSDVCRHLTVEKKNGKFLSLVNMALTFKVSLKGMILPGHIDTAIAWNYEQCHAEQHGAGRKHDETPQCTGRISVEEKKHSQLRAAWCSERIREYSELHVQHAMIVRQCHYEILSNKTEISMIVSWVPHCRGMQRFSMIPYRYSFSAFVIAGIHSCIELHCGTNNTCSYIQPEDTDFRYLTKSCQVLCPMKLQGSGIYSI